MPVPTLAASPAPAAAPHFDRDYWLNHCEGYRVHSADGRVGFVQEIRAESSGVPTLVVRAGWLGRRLLLISASEVAFIVPRDEHLWLKSPVAVLGVETP